MEVDPTEPIRREEVARINTAVASDNPDTERVRLEALYSKVWNTTQIGQDFEVLGFMAPYAIVRRKSDGKKGSLEFQHHPRFHFNFIPD